MTVMKSATKVLIATALGVALVAPVASYADDDHQEERIENSIRNDRNYQAKVGQARRNLQARGYRVKSIRPDAHNGRKTLEVEATKNGREWDIRLAYPSLRIISEKPD